MMENIKILKTLLTKTSLKFIKHRYKHSWIKPEGFDTGINIYNCIIKDKVPFFIKNKHLLTWYTCGPTVYDSSHIGHACCYMKLDIIQRILRNYFKYNLITVMNITDIDDKIITKANETKDLYKDVAKMYEKQFFNDLQDLGINKPNIIMRVTENMDLIIDFIKKLEDTGQAYKAEDHCVYFNTTDYSGYEKLQNIGNHTLQQEQNTFKKSAKDFALWKSSKNGEPFWHSPWGSGRPGWHIECSALASHVFGSNIDIHAGGIDLRFPHHENEEAQSCVYHNTQQWVNYWIHTGHLHLKDSDKMSKSLGNTVTIQQMLKDTDADVFRLACIMSHYRSNMEYTKELIVTAENLLKAYKNLINSCEEYKKGYLKATVNKEVLTKALGDAYENIHKALCDDFDTPTVIRILNELVSTTNSMLHTTLSGSETGVCVIAGISNFIVNTLSNFGINFAVKYKVGASEGIEDVIDILNTFRQDIRLIGILGKDQNILKHCDIVRDELKNVGIKIKDHGKVSSWSR